MSISPSKTIKFPSGNDISELEQRDQQRFLCLNYKFIKSADNKFFAAFARKEKHCAWIYKLDDTGSFHEKYYIEKLPSEFDFELKDSNNISIDNKGKYIYLVVDKKMGEAWENGDVIRVVNCYTSGYSSSDDNRLQWSVQLKGKINDPYHAPDPIILVDHRNNIFISNGNGKVITFHHNSPEDQIEISTDQHIDCVFDMKFANGGSMLFVSGRKGEALSDGTIVSVDLKTFHINYAFHANTLLDSTPCSKIFCSSTNLFYVDIKGMLHLHNIKSGVETLKTDALEDIDPMYRGYDIFYKNKHLFVCQGSRIVIYTLKGELIESIYIKDFTTPMILDFNHSKTLFVLDKIGVHHFDFELKAKAQSSIGFKLKKEDLDCDIYGFQDLSYFPDKEHLHLISNRKEFIIDIISGKWEQVENDEFYSYKRLSNRLTSNKYLLADYDEEHLFIQNLIKGSNYELEFDFDFEEQNTNLEFIVPYFSPDYRFFGLFNKNHIKIYDLERRRQLQDVSTPANVYNTTLSLSPCLPVAACHAIDSDQLNFYVWDLSDGKLLFSKKYTEFAEHDKEGCIHTFSPCGKYVLVVTFDFIYQYDLKGNLVLKRKFTGNEGSSTSASIYFISNDGYFVTGACESHVWHLDKEQPLFNLGEEFVYNKVIPLNNNKFVFWNKFGVNIISTSINTCPIVSSNDATPNWHNRKVIREANELEVKYIRKEEVDEQKEREAADQRRLEDERQERIKAEEQREEERALDAYRRKEEERAEEQRRRREKEEAESRYREEEEEERLRKEREEQDRSYTNEEIWNQSAGGVKLNALSACYYHQVDGKCSYRDRDDWCYARDGHYSNCWDTDSLDYCIKSEIGDKPREW